ncbi:MAG: DUF4956 domain-containing protein [Deltaproteobacteria bacterium]|nr:DUF4956 domain-containing protein [Deltaproteobacteria bacterium]
MIEWFGFQMLLDPKDFGKLVLRLVVDLGVVAVIVRGVYLRTSQRRDIAFSCVLLNIITFSICLLLRKVPVELGFALGLFGVFSILRYRTEPIGIKDLTYLFVLIGVGMLNAVANKKISLLELAFINLTIISATALLEIAPFMHRKDSRLFIYDNLALLKPDKHEDMLADLRQRTGLDITNFRINDVDMIREAAQVTVIYNLISAKKTKTTHATKAAKEG